MPANSALDYLWHMGELRLFAIGIDELRDLFSAAEPVARDFRRLAASHFPPPEPPRSPGLLGKLGPLFKRPPDAPVVRPGVPTEQEIAAIVSGRFIPPERLSAAWLLVETWLEHRSWGHHGIVADEDRFTDLEFDLARVGVPARFGLAKLLNRELGVPLRPCPGLLVGYVQHSHAVAIRDCWQSGLMGLSIENRAIAEPYVSWLAHFQEWAAQATAAYRPIPDLVALLRAEVTAPAG